VRFVGIGVFVSTRGGDDHNSHGCDWIHIGVIDLYTCVVYLHELNSHMCD
jgi:hypothetical protein